MSTPSSLAYSSRVIIAAADLLKALGCEGFDRFVLELQLLDRNAGHGDSLMARATSLANHVIQNPMQLTPERITAQWAIIRRAKELWIRGIETNLAAGERDTFAAAWAAEGLWRPLPEEAEREAQQAWIDELAGQASPATSPPNAVEKRLEIFQARPAFMGFSLDLKAIWFRCAPFLRRWWRGTS